MSEKAVNWAHDAENALYDAHCCTVERVRAKYLKEAISYLDAAKAEAAAELSKIEENA